MVGAEMEKVYLDLEAGHFESVWKSRMHKVQEMMLTPMEMLRKFFSSQANISTEFGGADHTLQRVEAMAHAGGEDIGDMLAMMVPVRRDSGMGHSSSDFGESLSSGSGSLSANVRLMQLGKSTSVEDEVFEEQTAAAASVDTEAPKKRLKTEP